MKLQEPHMAGLLKEAAAVKRESRSERVRRLAFHLQVLSTQPQGCCLNDLGFGNPWPSRPRPQSAAELWQAFQKQKVGLPSESFAPLKSHQ